MDSVSYGGTSYLVTSIGNNAFTISEYYDYYNHSRSYSGWHVTSIYFPKYIRAIHDDAFLGCSYVNKIIWNVQHYNLYSFNFGRNQLYNSFDTIVIGEDVVTVPTFRYRKYTDETSRYTYPKTLIFNARNATERHYDPTERNPSYYWFGLDSINKCILGPEVTALPNHFLEEAFNIDTIVLLNIVKYIGDSAFKDCLNTTILLPTLDSLEYVGSAAFKDCNN